MTQNILDRRVANLPLNVNDFMKAWKSAMDQRYGPDAPNYRQSRREARLQMINAFYGLGTPGTQSIDVTCKASTKKLESAQSGIWLPGCKTYHRISLSYFFTQCLKKNIFGCPLCGTNPITFVKEIKIDMLCYTYFDYISEGNATLITESQNAQGIVVENLTDGETLVNNKLVRWSLERIPAAFLKLMAQPALKALYKNVTQRNTNQLDGLLDSPSEQKTISISMLCQKSYRRVNFPILHKDCKSKNPDHGILMFDLYFVLGQLFALKNPQQRITCSKCDAFFSKQNFQSVCLTDRKLVDCVRGEPKSLNLLYFKLRQNQKIHLPRQQDKYINQQIEPANKNKLNETTTALMKTNVKNFFNSTSIIYKFYDEAIQKLLSKVEVPVRYQLSDKMRLPTRCKHCTTDKKPLDLWQYCLLSVSNTGKCPLCQASFAGQDVAKMIYVDYKMLPFLEQKYNRLILYKNPQNISGYEYNVDIIKTNGRQLRDIMLGQKRVIQKYDPEPETSQRIIPLLDWQKSYTPFIQKKCLALFQGNKNIKQYLEKHVMFVQPNKIVTQQSCKICKTKPQYIFDIALDLLVDKVLQNKEGFFMYVKGAGYQVKKKLNEFKDVKELLLYMRERQLFFKSDEFNFSYNICKKKEASGQYWAQFVQIPVKIIKCRCQSPKNTVKIVDLADLISGNRIQSCPGCQQPIAHPEDLELLQVLHRAIQSWLLVNKRTQSRSRQARYGVNILADGGGFTLTPVPQGSTQVRAPNIYDDFSKNVLTSEQPYYNEYLLFQKQYENKLQRLKKDAEERAKIVNPPTILSSGGGIYDCRNNLVRRFGNRIR